MHPQTDICIHPSLVLLPKLFQNQYGAAPQKHPGSPQQSSLIKNATWSSSNCTTIPILHIGQECQAGNKVSLLPSNSTSPPSQKHTCTHKMSAKYNPTHMQPVYQSAGFPSPAHTPPSLSLHPIKNDRNSIPQELNRPGMRINPNHWWRPKTRQLDGKFRTEQIPTACSKQKPSGRHPRGASAIV